jgi:two-component system phosphate regulon response regulator PhoB
LVLRIQKLLQRRQSLAESEVLRFGELVINIPRHEVWVASTLIELTLTEFRLLNLLAQRCGRVQSRERLLNDLWGFDSSIDSRSIDTHVRRLREKLGGAAEHLDTVRGVGYRFVE